MKKGPRGRLNSQQIAKIWAGWQSGESMSHIGRELDKDPATIFGVLKAAGGIAPRARTRATRALTVDEREVITRGLVAGESLRSIATLLGRSASTVSREVARNGGRVRYRAIAADQRAWRKARRPKACLLAQRPLLGLLVAEKLLLKWSPEQISGWLRVNHADDTSMQISHESIYRTIYVQGRKALNEGSYKQLRRGRIFRHSKHGTRLSKSTHSIVDGVPICQRPQVIQDRTSCGHWEGDLISGKDNSHVATLVERFSRFTVLVKVKGKDTKSVVDALSKKARELPEGIWKSLTWDRGSELADHQRLTSETHADIYFCDPSSPWQRGTNENTNRLLRQYFPKGTNLSIHSQADLEKVARELNQRPRKVLGFSSPEASLFSSVALTD